MPENKTIKGVIKNFYGRPLSKLKLKDGSTPPKSLKFEGPYVAYLNVQEIKDANNMPSDDEVLKFRNAQARNNARQKAQQAQMDAAGFIAPDAANDDLTALQNIAKTFTARGDSESVAKQKASAALGIEWPEDSDDDDE